MTRRLGFLYEGQVVVPPPRGDDWGIGVTRLQLHTFSYYIARAAFLTKFCIVVKRNVVMIVQTTLHYNLLMNSSSLLDMQDQPAYRDPITLPTFVNTSSHSP